MNAQQPPRAEPEERADKIDQNAQGLARQHRTLKDLLRGDDFQRAVAEVAPEVMRPTRFIRAAMTALLRVPKLADCTRESFFRAMLECAFLGIEPDGRRAHLIPFKNTRAGTVECQLIVDYKGLAELVRRSGDVSYVHCDVVYDQDSFEVRHGTGAQLIHVPNLESPRKTRRCFYSFVKLKDGSEDFIVMTPQEVEAIRRRSKSPTEGPWVTDFDEMGKKTVFRRHSKWLPLTAESRVGIERVDPEPGQPPTEAWSEMLAEGADQEPKRLAAREKILSHAALEEAVVAAAETVRTATDPVE